MFEGVAHIIHAGDIGGPEILRELEALAPVTAVRGNTDTAPWAWDLPEVAVVELMGRRLLVAHIRENLLRTRDPVGEGLSAVITGHSHSPAVHRVDGVLHLNPGSAGRRRFHLPRAVALLEIPDGARVSSGNEATGDVSLLPSGPLATGSDDLAAEIVILEPGSAPRV